MSGQKTLWSLVAVAVGFVAAWSVGPTATAQIGGGLGGGGFFGEGGLGGDAFGGPQSIAGEVMIQSGGTDGGPMQVILVSPTGSRVWGYSTARGEWKDSGFRGDARGPVTPVTGGLVAVFSTREKAYGFSSERGEWDTIELAGSGTPVVGTRVGVIADGRKVHAFSGLQGEWDTLELPEGAEVQPVVGQDYAEVRTATTVSIFSARTGKWATVKFAEE